MEIKIGDISLRKAKSSDKVFITELYKLPELKYYKKYIDFENLETILSNNKIYFNNDNHFILECENKIIALLSLSSYDIKNKTIILNYVLIYNEQDNDTLCLLLKEMFKKIFSSDNFNRIEMKVLSSSKEVISICDKASMITESVMREKIFLNNEFVDLITYGILLNEFLEV